MAYGQVYRRRRSGGGTLNLPSLVDVVFLLLIFFMITTTFSQILTKLDIELPTSRTVTEQKNKDTIIEIDAKGQIAYNAEIVNIGQLDRALGILAKNKPNEVIIIKGDKEVPYGKVIKIMGICRSHRLNRLAMAALHEEE